MHGGMRTAACARRHAHGTAMVATETRAREHVATALTSVVWGTCCRVTMRMQGPSCMISRPLDDYGR